MINLIISIVVLIFLFLFLANTTITFKPFSIKLPNWINAVITFVITFGLLFYIGYKEQKSYEKGWEDGAEYVIGRILEKKGK